ncbi:MurR/RpiR family transcriptional regulator [Kiloniella laminariae]|uniref:MurR/RpiR family transcriptional regulator n=1 Tax=Kiloniella laminariae TaxID=454162 RepID=A0ABT4LMG1_9PROT|nr:MurR/RpiR family transcriptional regulator [Kiloniella laminariae]MCZ4282296.1 MurR/RpiR family transcriptional regulator [Kiloniella laminariae]
MGLKTKSLVVEQLTSALPSYPKSLRRAAIFIIDNPAEFGMNSIRDSAEATGVSTNTLVRLAQKLGFESYQQLREPFRLALTSNVATANTSQWVNELYERGDKERIRADTVTSVVGNVTEALRQNDTDAIELAAELILAAENVYLMGTRASYTLVHYLYYIGRMALPNLIVAPRHANSPLDEILGVSSKDMVIAISITPFAKETIEACRYAKSRGAKLLLLSDSTANSLPLKPDITLISPVGTPRHFENFYGFDSFVGFFALSEWLITALVEKGGDKITKRIQSVNYLRKSAKVYWQP